MVDRCPACGKDRVLVGNRHLCWPVTKFSAGVTKLIEYEVTAPGRVKVGRRPLGEEAMTGAERMRRLRARRKGC